VCENDPEDIVPESKLPSGLQQLPDVTEWNPWKFQVTVWPAWIVVVLFPLCLSTKLLPPEGPTFTVGEADDGVGVAAGAGGVGVAVLPAAGVAVVPAGGVAVVIAGCVGALSFPQERTKASASARRTRRTRFMEHLLSEK
jgi:hypothetical protein